MADLIGSLNDPYSYVVVRLNGRSISRPNFETTLVPDDAEVIFIPMISGG